MDNMKVITEDLNDDNNNIVQVKSLETAAMTPSAKSLSAASFTTRKNRRMIESYGDVYSPQVHLFLSTRLNGEWIKITSCG